MLHRDRRAKGGEAPRGAPEERDLGEPSDGRVTHRAARMSTSREARGTMAIEERVSIEYPSFSSPSHSSSSCRCPLPPPPPPRPPLRFYHIMRGISLTRNGRKLPGCPLSLPPSFLPSSFAPRARDQRTYSKRQTALFVAASVKIASAKYSALHVHCIVEASSFASFAI